MLTLSDLDRAVNGPGPAVAIRSTLRLQPIGKPGDRIFPPTYPSPAKDAPPIHLFEPRRLADGERHDTVLLDSCQSQANRAEEALEAEARAGRIELPRVEVDFSGTDFPEYDRVSSIAAPHRLADAILRDSDDPQTRLPFRQTPYGQAFERSSVRAATGVFALCPASLLFGLWNSTGAGGGLGTKFPRAFVAEIIGVDVVPGTRPSSRIDPLEIVNLDIYEAVEGGWTVDRNEAVQLGPNKWKMYSRKQNSKTKGKTTELNHGNIKPSLVANNGVTVAYALQTVVLSLAGLRRLRFPEGDAYSDERDAAARSVLAALGLVAVTAQRERGFDLRSRCLLVGEDPAAPAAYELVYGDGRTEPVALDKAGAAVLLGQAVVRAREEHRLPWDPQPRRLVPSQRLLKLIAASRERVLAGVVEDDGSEAP